MSRFNERFKEFENIKTSINLIYSPKIVEVSKAPIELQIELLELKNDNLFIEKLTEICDLVAVWKTAYKYPKLREIARNVLVLFRSTYMCESTFSRLNYIKNKYRSR